MHHKDATRPGETTLRDLPPEAAGLIYIGRIRTPFATRQDCPRQGSVDGPECRIEVDDRFAPALDGVERFDHLEILYWLDRGRRDLLTQSPKSDGAVRGTFSLRSPMRPNPIGTARVRLIARKGNTLAVRGLDCLDDTPLLDIKPDRCGWSPQVPPKA